MFRSPAPPEGERSHRTLRCQPTIDSAKGTHAHTPNRTIDTILPHPHESVSNIELGARLVPYDSYVGHTLRRRRISALHRCASYEVTRHTFFLAVSGPEVSCKVEKVQWVTRTAASHRRSTRRWTSSPTLRRRGADGEMVFGSNNGWVWGVQGSARKPDAASWF